MGQAIDLLYQPIRLSGKNIDPRYFKDNGDGTYSLTPLLIRNIARDCADYCKTRVVGNEYIESIDPTRKYSTINTKTNEIEGFLIDDPEDLKKKKKYDEEFKVNYGEQLKEASKRWYTYRREHPDEFIKGVKRIQTGGEDENKYFNHFQPATDSIIANLSLEETMSLYKACMELLNKYSKPDDKGNGELYDTLPFEEPLSSKPEFVDQHKLFRAKVNQELGIPNVEYEVKKIKITTKTTISFIRSNSKVYSQGVISDDTHLTEYANALIKYLTNNTVVDYMNERKELNTLINSNTLYELLENKNIKVEKLNDSTEGIEIFTKYNDVSQKIIKIIDSVEPFTYEYKFYVKVNEVILMYNKPITTKIDLIDALKYTKELVKNSEIFNYLEMEIDSIIEALN